MVAKAAEPSAAASGEASITPFILAIHLVARAAFAFAWLKGGHSERFGVAVLLTGAMIEIFVVHLVLLAGAAERWLAGERPVSRIGPPQATTAA